MCPLAGVLELVDSIGSEPVARKRVWVRFPPPAFCDVSRHRRQMSRDIVDTSTPSDRLVVAARIEGQSADQLAGSGIEDADVAIGDEQLDRLALVGAPEADVVQL